MYGASRNLLWIIALLLAPVILHAQGSILIVLTQPPPNQLRISDFWKVDLTNTTAQDVSVYLRGYADEAVDGRIVDARSRVFTVPANRRIRVTGTMLEPITVDQWNERYKTIILRTGEMPTGEYNVCVEVHLVSDGSVVGTDCFDQTIELEQLTPPILIFPSDESIVTDKLPTFSWLAPTPMRRGDAMTYQLRIVEVLGRQTPFDAMQSNPAFFDLRDLGANLFRFPLGARGFKQGNTYAWQIRAFLGQRFGDRIPVGESEIWWFNYGHTVDLLRDDDFDDGEHVVRNKPPVLDPEIISMGGNVPRIGQTKVPVIKDISIKPGMIPPNINLNDISKVNPGMLLSPSALRALMHTCQGED